MNRRVLKFKNFTRWARLSIAFIALIIFIGVLAPYISPHSHKLPSGDALEPPSTSHLLGTDDLGIDILSQIFYGARLSLIIGFSTAILAGMGGAILGVISGYYGGLADKIIMRLADMMIALPSLAMMILLGAFFGPSTRNIVLVLVLFSWTGPARIVRSKIISIKKEGYIEMARSYDAGFFHLFRLHFLPEIMPVLAISIIRITSKAIVAEAGLSFLGLGDPTSKSWGLILNHSINFRGIYFTEYWKWWVIPPLAGTMILILSLSYISRDLERILNSKI